MPRDATDELINMMYYILIDQVATGSQREIAEEATLRLGRPIARHQVSRALDIVRGNPLLYGWTVNQVKRGPTLAGRYFVTVADTDEMADDDIERANDGDIGTFSYARTVVSTLIRTMKVRELKMSSPVMRRHCRSIIRDAEYFADKVADMEEDCRQVI